MKDKQVFVDTNILVYAYDKDAGKKHQVAKQKVATLWQSDTQSSISIQVLQELYVNLVRKGVVSKQARDVVEPYLSWNVVENDRNLLLSGMGNSDKWKISFWDGLIVAAAQRAGAHIIWSEDLNHSQRYGEVTVLNPFLI